MKMREMPTIYSFAERRSGDRNISLNAQTVEKVRFIVFDIVCSGKPNGLCSIVPY
jgi:hypothetical protein